MKLTTRKAKTVVLRQRLDGLMVAATVHPHRLAAEAQIELESKPFLARFGDEKPVGQFPMRWIIIPAVTVIESDHQWPPPEKPEPSKIITPGSPMPVPEGPRP